MIPCPVEGCRNETSDGLPCNRCILTLTDALKLAAPLARTLRDAPAMKVHPRDINLPAEQQRIIEDWPAGTNGGRHQPWEDSGNKWNGLDAELEFTVTRQTSKTPQPGGRSSDTVIPFNGNASDAAHELRRVLRYWVSVLAARDLDSAANIGDNIRAYAHWILRHTDWLRRHTDGSDMLTDIVGRINDAVKAVDATAGRIYAGRCAACGHDLFTRATDQHPDGLDDAVCRACEAVTSGRLSWREQRHASIDDQLIPQALILKALPMIGASEVSKQRLNGWLRRGKLQPAYRVWLSKTEPAPVLYRVADIKALAAPRTAA